VNNSILSNVSAYNSTIINSTLTSENIYGMTIINGLQVPNCGQNITRNAMLIGPIQSNGSCLIFGRNDLSLECNANKIIGNNNGTGIDFTGYNTLLIKNCQFNNYTIGLHITNAENLTIANSRITSTGIGILVGTNSRMNTITNMTFTNVSTSVLLNDNMNITFNDTYIQPNIIIEKPTAGHVNYSTGINATGTNFTFEGTFNITYASIQLNATKTPVLNTTAILRFYNIPYANPLPAIDKNDTGTFTKCENTCDAGTKDQDTFTYKVTHFTTYGVIQGPETQGGMSVGMMGAGGTIEGKPKPKATTEGPTPPPPLELPFPLTRPSEDETPSATPKTARPAAPAISLPAAGTEATPEPATEAPAEASKTAETKQVAIMKPISIAETSWTLALAITIIGLTAYAVSGGLFGGRHLAPVPPRLRTTPLPPPAAPEMQKAFSTTLKEIAKGPTQGLDAMIDLMLEMPTIMTKTILRMRIFLVYAWSATKEEIKNTIKLARYWTLETSYLTRSQIRYTTDELTRSIKALTAPAKKAMRQLKIKDTVSGLNDSAKQWSLKRKLRSIEEGMENLNKEIAKQGKQEWNTMKSEAQREAKMAEEKMGSATSSILMLPIQASRGLLAISQNAISGYNQAATDIKDWTDRHTRSVTEAYTRSIDKYESAAKKAKEALTQRKINHIQKVTGKIDNKIAKQKTGTGKIKQLASLKITEAGSAFEKIAKNAYEKKKQTTDTIKTHLKKITSNAKDLLINAKRSMTESQEPLIKTSKKIISETKQRYNDFLKRRKARSIETLNRKIDRERMN